MSKPDIKLAESMLGTPYHAVAMNTIAAADRRKVEIHDELVAVLSRFYAATYGKTDLIPPLDFEQASAALAKAKAIP